MYIIPLAGEVLCFVFNIENSWTQRWPREPYVSTKVTLLLPLGICFDRKGEWSDLQELAFSDFSGVICFLLKYEWSIRTAIFCTQKSLDPCLIKKKKKVPRSMFLQWNMFPHKSALRSDSDLLWCWWMLFLNSISKNWETDINTHNFRPLEPKLIW